MTCANASPTPWYNGDFENTIIRPPWVQDYTSVCNCELSRSELTYRSATNSGEFIVGKEPVAGRPLKYPSFGQDNVLTCPNAYYIAQYFYRMSSKNNGIKSIGIHTADACQGGTTREWVPSIGSFVDVAALSAQLKTVWTSAPNYFVPNSYITDIRVNLAHDDAKQDKIYFDDIELTLRGLIYKDDTFLINQPVNDKPTQWKTEGISFNRALNEYVTPMPQGQEAGVNYDTYPGVENARMATRLYCKNNSPNKDSWSIGRLSYPTGGGSVCNKIFSLQVTGNVTSLTSNGDAYIIFQQGDKKPYLEEPPYDPKEKPEQSLHAWVAANQMFPIAWSSSPGQIPKYELPNRYYGTGQPGLSVSLACGPNTEAELYISELSLYQQENLGL